MRGLMDRTCSGSGLTRGCQPKYPTEVSSTCVGAYFRGVLRIAMELRWPYRCGAMGESSDRSRSWEGADLACRDQRTSRCSVHAGYAPVAGGAARRRDAELCRWAFGI